MLKLIDTLLAQWKFILGLYCPPLCATPTKPLSLTEIGEFCQSSPAPVAPTDVEKYDVVFVVVEEAALASIKGAVIPPLEIVPILVRFLEESTISVLFNL